MGMNKKKKTKKDNETPSKMTTPEVGSKSSRKNKHVQFDEHDKKVRFGKNIAKGKKLWIPRRLVRLNCYCELTYNVYLQIIKIQLWA